jgi:hypothetical protein
MPEIMKTIISPLYVLVMVAGNKVKATLAGIALEADTVQSGFANLKVGESAKPEALSGNLTFYK